MGSDKLYRWDKRRERESRNDKAFHMEMLDWVMLTLICVMFFVSLRLFFMFETTTAPCVEILMTTGESSGYPPIFQLTFIITLLIGLFWLCVTVQRVLTKSAHWALISWHFVMFLSIIFLSAANWNLTPSAYVNPPDGVMVVENRVPVNTGAGIIWQSRSRLNWADYRDGQWYAVGSQSCIWLDENKVSYNNRFDLNKKTRSVSKLLFEGRAIEVLKDNQLYRPLSEYEREVFLEIKACQADVTRYGQHASECQSYSTYPTPPDKKPPLEFLETWPMD